MFKEALVPISENFNSWNITSEGIALLLMHAKSIAAQKANRKLRFRSLVWSNY